MGGAEQPKSVPHLADPGKEARAAAGIPIVPVFDGYRAYAILGIVLIHMLDRSGVIQSGDGDWLARLVWGTIGHAIDVLFVVSGFVVFMPTVARQGNFGSYGAYAIRRAARLIPAYWMILVISLVLLATVNLDDPIAFPDLQQIIIHLLGLQTPLGMLPIDLTTGFGVNGPLWALSVEICFYVVLPFIAAIYFRRPWVGLAVAAASTLIWNYGFEHIFDVTDFLGLGISGLEGLRLNAESTLQLPSWAFSFGLGMTGAWVYVKLQGKVDARRLKAAKAVQLVSLVGLAFFAYLAGGYSDDAPLQLVAEVSRQSPEIAIGYSGFLALLMVSTALGPDWARRPFAGLRVRALGDISYGIYLSHIVFATYLGSMLSLPHGGTLADLSLWLAVVVPPSIIYGYLSARYLEQPIRRWARQFGRRQEG